MQRKELFANAISAFISSEKERKEKASEKKKRNKDREEKEKLPECYEYPCEYLISEVFKNILKKRINGESDGLPSEKAPVLMVTHPVKLVDPEASDKGNGAHSVNAREWLMNRAEKIPPHYIGSHSLKDMAEDAECSSSYGPAGRFFTLRVPLPEKGNVNMASLVMDEDNREEFVSILSTDRNKAEWLLAEMRKMTRRPKGQIRAHKRLRQVYFPIASGKYHLLVPLMSSSLAHELSMRLHAEKFGQAAKDARDAKKEGKFSEIPCLSHPGTLIYTCGGTHPENMGVFNLLRHGEMRLLCALPPSWKDSELRLPAGRRSVFGTFLAGMPRIAEMQEALSGFYAKTSSYKNMKIRQIYDYLLSELLNAIFIWVENARNQQSGWTDNDKFASLIRDEKIWLDPFNEKFLEERANPVWIERISARMSNWLVEWMSERFNGINDDHNDTFRSAIKRRIKDMERANA